MASQGPNSPGTMADDATIGTVAWTSPNGAKVSDNIYTGSVLSDAVVQHYLKATNFGFSIPEGATIDGILVEVEQLSFEGLSNTTENSIKIVKDGVISGDDKSTNATIPATDTYISYGGESDLWGLSFTSEDINNSDFGVVFSGKNSASVHFISVDHIRITVYYTKNKSPFPTFFQT
jgi:hypothetical protein